MTMTQKQILTVLTGVSDDQVLTVYLNQAEGAILGHTGLKTVPSALASFVIELAAYRIDKRGADYQSAHSENGVSRSWDVDMMDAPKDFWKAVDKALQSVSDAGAGWIV